MPDDEQERIRAIEQRARQAVDAWNHGDIATLQTLTLVDVPWLLDIAKEVVDTESCPVRKSRGGNHVE